MHSVIWYKFEAKYYNKKKFFSFRMENVKQILRGILYKIRWEILIFRREANLQITPRICVSRRNGIMEMAYIVGP
jgi:hypothetical protein